MCVDYSLVTQIVIIINFGLKIQELQQQRHESQKALIQAKTNTDVLVMDLECKLRSASNNLEAEQNAHRVTKEEQQKELDALQVDNAKLHAKIQTVSSRIHGLIFIENVCM